MTERSLALAVALMTLVATQREHRFVEVHMGVPVRISMYARDDRAAASAARAAFQHIAALEDKMSDYRPESEVRRLERRPGEWVRASAPLYDVLAQAIAIA